VINKLKALSLSTDRLSIRPIIDADLRAIYAIHTNPVVNRHLPYDTWHDWDDAKHWYAYVQERRASGIAEQFVIETDTTLIGTCIAFNHDVKTQSLEFGYVLNQDYWGNGYMYEAMQAFVPALQDTLDLELLTASVEVDNTSSLKLLDKLGFSRSRRFVEESAELYSLYIKSS